MKKILTIIILSLNVALSLAQWSIAPSLGVGAAMTDDHDVGTLNLELDYRVSTLFSFGFLSSFQYEASSPNSIAQKYSNLMYVLKTDILDVFNKHGLYDLYFDTGFGWGHHYTRARTDHNFHTYLLGLDYRLYNDDKSLGGIVKIGTQFRTFGEHIGFNPIYGKIVFSVGVVHCF